MQYGMSCSKQIQPVLTFMYSRGFGIGSPITDIQALKGVKSTARYPVFWTPSPPPFQHFGPIYSTLIMNATSLTASELG